ncbi:MAG: hypothetical protein P4L62_05105 [Candidatus Pacebacteria bacterium]|nr:hypothetical protein [Candidatus Paceibacterota bacterium]MDR3583695.1 hypothetical protein [Candidatus Paceibacterota bacterium]
MKTRIAKKAAAITVFALTAPAVVLAQTTTGSGGWSTGLTNAKAFGLPSGSIYTIISNTLSWILGIFGFIGVIGFVISGLLYLTAAGDDGKMETAKNAMTYSIIGVIVGLAGLVVITAVNALLGATSTQF